MTLTLVRANARRPLRPERASSYTARRRDRAMHRLARAIRYGLSMPDSEAARQARLLADIFGPQLGLALDEPPQQRLAAGVLRQV
jgi:hypothetical protein